MADKSAIEWTDATWNPVVGCSIVSPGCTNCYAMKMAARLEAMGQPIYAGTTKKVNGNTVWTGKVEQSNWGQLIKPLSWKRPRRIFVNSMSDLFHESVSDETIDLVFAIMALCPQHTFQILTKRASRLEQYLSTSAQAFPGAERRDDVAATAFALNDDLSADKKQNRFTENDILLNGNRWPLPNVWLGVSCERQQEADERIPLLLGTPAAIRFISAEPLLGPIDLGDWITAWGGRNGLIEYLDWVIVGGESGPGARPMHPEWARSLRDQCADADVPFFFKQWGEFSPVPIEDRSAYCRGGKFKGRSFERIEGAALVRWGKKGTGRKLDGKEHNEFPQAREIAFA